MAILLSGQMPIPRPRPSDQSMPPVAVAVPLICLPRCRLKRWPPGHELEAEPVVDHREASRGELHALAVDAAHMLARCRWPMLESGARRDRANGRVHLAAAECLDPLPG